MPRALTRYRTTRSGMRYNPYGAITRPRISTRIINNPRLAGSMTISRRGRRATSGQGVTDQYDRRLIYRKRRMPRYKKRQWKRFRNRVLAVSEKDLGSRTVVFNSQYNYSETGTNCDTKNVLGQIALYSIKHAVFGFFNDIDNITSSDPLGATNGKFLFHSAVLDVTITNVTKMVPDGAGETEPVVPWTLELDIYEISCSKNFETQSASSTLLDCFDEGATDTPAIWGTSLTLADRGTTPFDLPSALSEFGIRVWKKTKYELSYGKTITYQIRDPKRHIVDRASISDYKSTNKPGLTRWLLIIGKPVPGFVSDVLNTCKYYLGVTRKYMYKVKQVNVDADHITV